MDENVLKSKIYNFLKHFYDLTDNKASIDEFFKIFDENIEFRFNEIAFIGFEGFKKHQEGKKAFFNEKHEFKITKIESFDDKIVAYTDGIWQANYKDDNSKIAKLKANILHKWTISEANQKLILISNEVLSLKILEGNFPKYLKD